MADRKHWKEFTVADVSRLVSWASVECEKQQSGERSVWWMIEGWSFAYRHRHEAVTEEFIQRLAAVVEPRHNRPNEWRQVDVRVGADIKAHWRRVPELMADVVALWSGTDADTWYKEFEEVHPLRDGNGRVGNILWNLHQDRLAPRRIDFPPDFWDYPRLKIPDSRQPLRVAVIEGRGR